MDQVVIEKYNPEWEEIFLEESSRIASVAGGCLIDLFHVGSTSVPSLSAKPIIDIIFVTTDLTKAREILTSENLGYKYKGEYNLPLHDLYGKKGKFEIYLHVHLRNSPEIKLNLMFRDYLRSHPEACEEYVQAKVNACRIEGAAEKVSIGVTRYNLMKNDVLTSLLKKTGFSELCVRFVTQEAEQKIFKRYRWSNLLNAPEVLSSKKVILYQGIDIIGAAEFFGCHKYGRFWINFADSEINDGFLKLINTIENYVKIRADAKILMANVTQIERPRYESLGYSRDSSLKRIVLCKKLG